MCVYVCDLCGYSVSGYCGPYASGCGRLQSTTTPHADKPYTPAHTRPRSTQTHIPHASIQAHTHIHTQVTITTLLAWPIAACPTRASATTDRCVYVCACVCGCVWMCVCMCMCVLRQSVCLQICGANAPYQCGYYLGCTRYVCCCVCVCVMVCVCVYVWCAMDIPFAVPCVGLTCQQQVSSCLLLCVACTCVCLCVCSCMCVAGHPMWPGQRRLRQNTAVRHLHFGEFVCASVYVCMMSVWMYVSTYVACSHSCASAAASLRWKWLWKGVYVCAV